MTKLFEDLLPDRLHHAFEDILDDLLGEEIKRPFKVAFPTESSEPGWFWINSHDRPTFRIELNRPADTTTVVANLTVCLEVIESIPAKLDTLLRDTRFITHVNGQIIFNSFRNAFFFEADETIGQIRSRIGFAPEQKIYWEVTLYGTLMKWDDNGDYFGIKDLLTRKRLEGNNGNIFYSLFSETLIIQ